MKKIEAIVNPLKVDQVKTALFKLGVRRIVVSDIKEFGLPDRHTHVFRGSEFTVDFTPEIKLEIVVPDDQVEAATSVLLDATDSQHEDGSLLVLPIETGFEQPVGAGRF